MLWTDHSQPAYVYIAAVLMALSLGKICKRLEISTEAQRKFFIFAYKKNYFRVENLFRTHVILYVGSRSEKSE
ncbi:MAG: hypothetical protein LBD27_04545, partial [Tannerella sp.]|nr:hypothetical protein [Tannerella sp.]